MEEVAGWIAPAATMIAAMMTASNLGARFTGWGFVVFLVGSIAWSAFALLTDQPNLLWTNLFLCLVNFVGIWRWLGRRARYEQGGKAAAEASAERLVTRLFAVSSIDGKPVTDPEGATIAHAIDAMARMADGGISYIVVREGGVAGMGEKLHMLEWRDLHMTAERIETGLTAEALAQRPAIAPERWPSHPAEAHG